MTEEEQLSCELVWTLVRITVLMFMLGGLLMIFIMLVMVGRNAASHEWYTGLKSVEGRSCCNQRDCRPVPARWNPKRLDYDLEVLPGAWFSVPSERVIKEPSRDGGWHWCALPGKPLRPICVIIPAQGS